MVCVCVCVRQEREQKVRENSEVTGKRFITVSIITCLKSVAKILSDQSNQNLILKPD